jgi:hypothetical protein
LISWGGLISKTGTCAPERLAEGVSFNGAYVSIA